MDEFLKRLDIFLGMPVYLQVIISVAVLVVSILSIFFLYVRYIRESDILNAEGFDFKNHRFFSYLDSFVEMKASLIDFKNEGKNEVISETLLIIMANAFKDEFTKLVDEFKENDHPSDVKNNFLQTLYRSLNLLEIEFTQAFDNEEEKFIVEYIYQKFKIINNKSFTNVQQTIEYVFDSTNSSGNVSRMEASLYFLIQPFEELTTNLVVMFNELNGNLKGKKYKNKEF